MMIASIGVNLVRLAGYGLVALGIVSFACCAPAAAATIAYWQFESGNFTGDSSGNSHTLANTGVTSSLDVAGDAPGTGSASFNGSQTAFSTIATLNLSSHTDLTVEWFMKTSQSSTAAVIEHNGLSGPGAFGVFINDLQANHVETFQRGSTWTGPSANGTYFEDAPRPLDGAWHHYAVVFDGSETNSDRLSLFIDGIDVGTINNAFTGSGTPLFRDETMFLGSRSNTNFKFTGLLDEVRISSGILSPSEFLNVPPVLPIVPEPATGLMCALSILLGAMVRRRTAGYRIAI